jgi:uncharacterized membrane protein YgcG
MHSRNASERDSSGRAEAAPEGCGEGLERIARRRARSARRLAQNKIFNQQNVISMKSFSIFLLLFIGLNTWITAQNIPKKPEPARYMVDNAAMLSSADGSLIENRLYDYFQATGVQIVVVTVISLDGETVETYAEKLFKTWGIGDKGRKDGVLLLLSKNDRKMRIEVGYGLEAHVTDAIAANIISSNLTPNFKNKEFYEGIREATARLISIISPDYRSETTRQDSLKTAFKAEKIANQQRENARIEKERAAAAAAIGSLIFYIVLGLLAFALFFYLVNRYLTYLQNKAVYFANALKNCEKAATQLDSISKLKAYSELPPVKEFVDNYSEALKKAIDDLEQNRGLEAAEMLLTDNAASLSGYLVLAAAYQKVALRRDYNDYEYYPEEEQRVEEKNIRELQTFASLSQVKKSSNYSLINAIGERLPAKKLSIVILTRLLPFAALGSRYDAVKMAAIALFESIEKADDFQAQIKAQPQEKVVLNEKIVLAFNYIDKLIEVLQLLQTASQRITKIAVYSHITDFYKDKALDLAKAEATHILRNLELPILKEDLAMQLKEKLANVSIQADIDKFYSLIYPPVFKDLHALLLAFNEPKALLLKYKWTHTEDSITALNKSIIAALAKLSSDFATGKTATFSELVDIFNGIFSTTAFLDKFLVKIYTPSRSYTATSSPSYTSSYSDYKAPYSDYKPPYSDYSDYSDKKYSDYSDYSDSSYGGGSSGGGGASGGW